MFPKLIHRAVLPRRQLRQIVHFQSTYQRSTQAGSRTASLQALPRPWVTSLPSLSPRQATPPVSLCHKYFRAHRTHPKLSLLFAGGILGLLGIHDDEEEEGKVPLSVKRELLKAKRAQANSDYDTAEESYHKALQLLGTSEHDQTQVYVEARAVTLDLLGNLYLEQRKYDQAEDVFKETLRLIFAVEKTFETMAVTEISLKLSKIYANQKRYKEARVGFQWCVDTAKRLQEESKNEDSTAMLGICYECQAKYFSMVGEHDKALEGFREAKKIASDLLGTQSLQYADMLTNEAAAVIALKQPDYLSNGEQLLRESLKIMEALNESEAARNIAVTSYNLAMVLALKDPTDQRVETLLRKSIALLEDQANNEMASEDLEFYYYNLGTTLLGQGKTEDAKSALHRAKALATKTGNSVLLEHIQATLASSK